MKQEDKVAYREDGMFGLFNLIVNNGHHPAILQFRGSNGFWEPHTYKLKGGK